MQYNDCYQFDRRTKKVSEYFTNVQQTCVRKAKDFLNKLNKNEVDDMLPTVCSNSNTYWNYTRITNMGKVLEFFYWKSFLLKKFWGHAYRVNRVPIISEVCSSKTATINRLKSAVNFMSGLNDPVSKVFFTNIYTANSNQHMLYRFCFAVLIDIFSKDKKVCRAQLRTLEMRKCDGIQTSAGLIRMLFISFATDVMPLFTCLH